MMKNKIKLKKFLLEIFTLSIFIVTVSCIIEISEYNTYTKNFNHKISSLIYQLEEKYPNLTENEIMEILNHSGHESELLQKYNIDVNKDAVVLENHNSFHKFIVLNIIFLLFMILGFVSLFLKFNGNKDKEISEITKCIEEINKKNYKLNIGEISEDELSILKNEIYKTTIMLKEQAENSTKEKLELKDSLSDISHQLKTPLTSILIILDNLIEDSEMDKKTREDFIFDVKREINNINFLVQDLLKLSKLDTNTVTFIEEKVHLKVMIDESVKKLSMLCDLKNIRINVYVKDDVIIHADSKWQMEAISNILKNCIEHSSQDSNIDIIVENCKIYSQIIIRDYGSGIDAKDLPHIFERFYKGEDASHDSIGIGLALAKKIIEQSNGKIFVDSKKGVGTTFKIQYYH